MDPGRRKLLQAGGAVIALSPALALGAGGAVVAAASERADATESAFASAEIDAAIGLLGWGKAIASAAVQFAEPTQDVAENGDAVSVAVTSSVAGTTAIALLVEKNSRVLAAVFNIGPGTEAFVSTRLKFSESSRVVAVARAQGAAYFAGRSIAVTQCGCSA